MSGSGSLPVAVPGSQQEVSAVLGDTVEIYQNIFFLTVQQYFYGTVNSVYCKVKAKLKTHKLHKIHF